MLISKLKTAEKRLAYAQKALENGWSPNVLMMQIETRLFERQGMSGVEIEALVADIKKDIS